MKPPACDDTEGWAEKLRAGSFVYREIAEKGVEVYVAKEDQ